MLKVIPVTTEGLTRFKKEKEDLLEKRKGAVISLRTAREMGDLSENAAYKVARMELSGIDARLRKLEYIIRFSKIIENTDHSKVGFETKVKIESEGKILEFTVVGGYESNPSQGKISHMSPLGRALFGRRAGEEINVVTPQGIKKYKLISIA